ncbi:hypothetical protein CSUI_009610 [Cystoisospora suis]|uniref:Transmembrane protein n=1 Tax=Cystoisospora suis TaxID=483139 RepID=A0A2C6KJB8_9APIC|nr:hypothetical protein CSUI_009610 [Cystoisospora suis]
MPMNGSPRGKRTPRHNLELSYKRSVHTKRNLLPAKSYRVRLLACLERELTSKPSSWRGILCTLFLSLLSSWLLSIVTVSRLVSLLMSRFLTSVRCLLTQGLITSITRPLSSTLHYVIVSKADRSGHNYCCRYGCRRPRRAIKCT